MSEEQQRTLLERPEVPVMFVRTEDDQPSITRAWAVLEELVGSLRGRKFYGVFDPVSREYALIGPTFQRLAKRPDCDHQRSGVAFYRRRDVIDLLQPIV